MAPAPTPLREGPRVWSPELARVRGVRVEGCVPGSAAARAGILPGDLVEAVNGEPVDDLIDVQVLTDDLHFTLTMRRDASRREASRLGAVQDRAPSQYAIELTRDYGEFHGLLLEDPPIKQCTNFCPFCFVDQAPARKGLRRGLEIKDDDYRYSFLYGHYVTLTNLSRAQLERIGRLRLSPLYVSVHATDPLVRAQLLGRPKVEILPLLKKLAALEIVLHTQIVLIPGLNDDRVLEQSVSDLFALHPAVQSVAIVPVGLTSYQRQGVRGWKKSTARAALRQIFALGQRFPTGFVQAADEWFSILAEDPPPAEYYGGMAVEENGVGLVRRMLDDWKGITLPQRVRNRRGVIVTGKSPERWMRRMVEKINTVPGARFELVVVENHTYGPVTTVTGLLGWADFARALGDRKSETVYLPDVCLTQSGRFLDDVTLETARSSSGCNIKTVPATAAGLASVLSA